LWAERNKIMTKKKSKGPAAPQPVNYDQIMRQSSANAQEQIAAQAAAQQASYRTMLADALGATDQIAWRLNNQYTADALGATREVSGDLQGMRGAASEMGRLGQLAQRDLDGTELERMLQVQAERELALGRALTPEQERESQQAARAGFAARGMATGNPSAMAEILNRDAYGTQREAQRREFAFGVNQMNEGNRMGRIGLAGQMTGQQAQTLGAAGGLGLGQAQNFIGIDPYQRALGSSIPGQALQGSLGMAGMAGDAYGRNQQLAGQVAGFNTNMQTNLYNSWLNNQAAMRGAQMQAGATASAGKDAMTGQLVGAGGAVAGAAIMGGLVIF
jgi:hypothetical protein